MIITTAVALREIMRVRMVCSVDSREELGAVGKAADEAAEPENCGDTTDPDSEIPVVKEVEPVDVELPTCGVTELADISEMECSVVDPDCMTTDDVPEVSWNEDWEVPVSTGVKADGEAVGDVLCGFGASGEDCGVDALDVPGSPVPSSLD